MKNQSVIRSTTISLIIIASLLTGCRPSIVGSEDSLAIVNNLSSDANSQTVQNYGVWDLSTTFPGAGAYSGITSIPSANEICSGRNFLGEATTAICQDSSSATTDPNLPPQVLFGTVLYDSAGKKVTGSMPLGDNVSGANGSLSAIIPAGYYDGTKNCTMSHTNLVASNIKSGTAIFGVSGSATCLDDSQQTANTLLPPKLLTGSVLYDGLGKQVTGTMANRGAGSITPGGSPVSIPEGYYDGTGTVGACAAPTGVETILGSNIGRDKTTTQRTISQEYSYFDSDGYRARPVVAKDDDGSNAVNVTFAVRPSVNCGTTQATIAEKISDCATQNGANASWNGATKANGGQGPWRLVTRGGGYEVWRDERTKLLWSDALAYTSWCRSAGNIENAGGIDCAPGGFSQPATPESWCAESAGFVTPATYDSRKGNMGVGTTPSVKWRLPSRADWMQAEVNGLRFVLPSMGTSWWTTTIQAVSRNNAWYFDGTNGFFGNAARNATYNMARCVGIAN
ncbi:MAG: hypothetical protein A2428_06835 [Bdellovibrionales bacterium RIFOXYC1_FULL_54_43]|nr:MAG: hypothetical protein A2428_06835 [Bdellovibrionales bacterium RIFOXYC1_FULL_54_43]OFZ79105.1 MAG: hypothetical protein A2603_10770 [Bdellovibrionales bacterium RIFOXYD1_FULL_55_31]